MYTVIDVLPGGEHLNYGIFSPFPHKNSIIPIYQEAVGQNFNRGTDDGKTKYTFFFIIIIYSISFTCPDLHLRHFLSNCIMEFVDFTQHTPIGS